VIGNAKLEARAASPLGNAIRPRSLRERLAVYFDSATLRPFEKSDLRGRCACSNLVDSAARQGKTVVGFQRLEKCIKALEPSIAAPTRIARRADSDQMENVEAGIHAASAGCRPERRRIANTLHCVDRFKMSKPFASA
jgi:hypothetical protein